MFPDNTHLADRNVTSITNENEFTIMLYDKLSDIDETATMRENALAVVLSPRIAGAEKNSNDMENSLASFESEINAVNNSIKLHGDAIKELVDKQVSLMLINVKEKADKRKHKFIDLNESLHA
jgi:hypothetical protein